MNLQPLLLHPLMIVSAELPNKSQPMLSFRRSPTLIDFHRIVFSTVKREKAQHALRDARVWWCLMDESESCQACGYLAKK
jgi:hypothetical protein